MCDVICLRPPFYLDSFVEPPVRRIDFSATCRQNLSKQFFLASIRIADVVTHPVQTNDKQTSLDLGQGFAIDVICWERTGVLNRWQSGRILTFHFEGKLKFTRMLIDSKTLGTNLWKEGVYKQLR